jgi:hypothetical protein
MRERDVWYGVRGLRAVGAIAESKVVVTAWAGKVVTPIRVYIEEVVDRLIS